MTGRPLSVRVVAVTGPEPTLKSAGLEWPALGTVDQLADLVDDAAVDLGVTVISTHVGSESDLVGHIEAATRDADGMVIAPGPSLRNSEVVRRSVERSGLPTVEVVPGSLRDPLADHRGSLVGEACIHTIAGRGADAYLGALRHLVHRAAWPFETHRYGPDPGHVGDLRLPAGAGPHPVAVLYHGGYWWPSWERDLLDGIAVDLARRGIATWNVEYRRIGRGGGWPQTADDAADAVGHLARLAEDHPLDLDRVTVVGHSAGAPTAVWAIGRQPDRGTVGRRDRVEVHRLVALAGVLDFPVAGTTTFGRAALRAFFDGQDPAGSPSELLPLDVPSVLVHAIDDDIVPVDASRRYAEAARAAGDDVALTELASDEHHALIRPESPAGGQVAELIADL